MATNPMQRKARNSFLLGFLTMLIIAAVIIGILFFMLLKVKKEQKEEEAVSKTVYTLVADVKSGETIDMTKIKTIEATPDVAPASALTMLGNDIVAKVDLKAGTVLTDELVTASGEEITSDLRQQEYNMILLPTEIQSGDYIDVRLMLPSGLDYIVLSKKTVSIPMINGADSEDTIYLNMSEDETLIMNNAIVESWKIAGSKLYAVKYIEPGMQDAAIQNYPINSEILKLISTDKNIVEKAKQELAKRYSTEYLNAQRGNVNSALENNSETSQETLKENLNTHITTQKENRKKYIESLTGTNMD